MIQIFFLIFKKYILALKNFLLYNLLRKRESIFENNCKENVCTLKGRMELNLDHIWNSKPSSTFLKRNNGKLG